MKRGSVLSKVGRQAHPIIVRGKQKYSQRLAKVIKSNVHLHHHLKTAGSAAPSRQTQQTPPHLPRRSTCPASLASQPCVSCLR